MAQNTSRPRTAVIAGATGNVGQATATALARLGYRVITLGRNRERLESRARAITEGLRAEAQDVKGEIIPLETDLTDPAAIRQTARAIEDSFAPVDLLVLSAVTYTQDGPTILPDGNELMFSTNLLGPFRLACLLKPALAASGGLIAHVIAPFNRKIDWDDLQSLQHHKPMQAYERTKTGHRVLAGEMARRWGADCSSFAFDPGFVVDPDDPDLKKRWPRGATGLLWRVYAWVAAKHPSVAGEALAGIVAHSTNPRDLNGAHFVLEKRQATPDPAITDTALGKRLWSALEALAFPDAPS